VGFQREIMRDLALDVSYVGNRSAWFVAPLLGALNYNALTPEGLKSRYGIDVTNRTDTALLNTPINSTLVTHRFPWLANPNSVYFGFPATQPLNQALRDYPQWNGIPPPGTAQWKYPVRLASNRYQAPSRTASMQLAYAGRELTNGTNSNTSYVSAVGAADQRRIQQSAEQADFRVQPAASADHFVQLTRRLRYRSDRSAFPRHCRGRRATGLSAES
jgi:hypothetical protein